MMWVFEGQSFTRWERGLIEAGMIKESGLDFRRGRQISLYLGERVDINRQGVSRIAIEFSKMASRVERYLEDQERRRSR